MVSIRKFCRLNHFAKRLKKWFHEFRSISFPSVILFSFSFVRETSLLILGCSCSDTSFKYNVLSLWSLISYHEDENYRSSGHKGKQPPGCTFKERWYEHSQLKELALAYPANNYLLKVDNRNTRKRCDICSKLTIKTPERRQVCKLTHFSLDFHYSTRTSSNVFRGYRNGTLG